mmetsp:Transcript_85523/g.183349  ORF Transcript_85523/g.183349 Transcript_85523/m.183349 type:complete len:290 (-) Transcript_85523:244-1113(-)
MYSLWPPSSSQWPGSTRGTCCPAVGVVCHCLTCSWPLSSYLPDLSPNCNCANFDEDGLAAKRSADRDASDPPAEVARPASPPAPPPLLGGGGLQSAGCTPTAGLGLPLRWQRADPGAHATCTGTDVEPPQRGVSAPLPIDIPDAVACSITAERARRPGAPLRAADLGVDANLSALVESAATAAGLPGVWAPLFAPLRPITPLEDSAFLEDTLPQLVPRAILRGVSFLLTLLLKAGCAPRLGATRSVAQAGFRIAASGWRTGTLGDRGGDAAISRLAAVPGDRTAHEPVL